MRKVRLRRTLEPGNATTPPRWGLAPVGAELEVDDETANVWVRIKQFAVYVDAHEAPVETATAEDAPERAATRTTRKRTRRKS